MDQNTQQLMEKCSPILDYEGAGEIKDAHRRAVTAQLLENQEREAHEQALPRREPPANSGHAPAGSNVDGFDPVLISLIRRSMPNLIAYDVCGVQPNVWSYWTDLRNALPPRWSDWC